MNREATLTALPQEVGGNDNGLYRVQLAMLEFDDIPSDPDHDSPATATSSSTPAASSVLSTPEHGNAAKVFGFGFLHRYTMYILALHVLVYSR